MICFLLTCEVGTQFNGCVRFTQYLWVKVPYAEKTEDKMGPYTSPW